MRKAASYSEFRKKTVHCKQGRGNEIKEIDELSKMLGELGTGRMKPGIEEKYLSRNAIMEVDEDEPVQNSFNKKSETANKPKKTESKIPRYQCPTQRTNQTKNSKINKSFDSSAKNSARGETYRNLKPAETTKSLHPIQNRRSSLKISEQPLSLMSTWSSVNLSNSNINIMNENELVYSALQRISEKIGNKNIPTKTIEDILQKLESVEEILDYC